MRRAVTRPGRRRRDECARVRKAGARVMTLDQIEGLKDHRVDCWGTEEDDDGDPPRCAPARKT